MTSAHKMFSSTKEAEGTGVRHTLMRFMCGVTCSIHRGPSARKMPLFPVTRNFDGPSLSSKLLLSYDNHILDIGPIK